MVRIWDAKINPTAREADVNDTLIAIRFDETSNEYKITKFLVLRKDERTAKNGNRLQPKYTLIFVGDDGKPRQVETVKFGLLYANELDAINDEFKFLFVSVRQDFEADSICGRTFRVGNIEDMKALNDRISKLISLKEQFSK